MSLIVLWTNQQRETVTSPVFIHILFWVNRGQDRKERTCPNYILGVIPFFVGHILTIEDCEEPFALIASSHNIILGALNRVTKALFRAITGWIIIISVCY